MSKSLEHYVELAKSTEFDDFKKFSKRLEDTNLVRLLHSGIGMATETGEFLDNLKRCIFYGTSFDETNAIEELGDLLWYIATACDTLEVSLEEVMKKNIAKLRKRYPQKYSDEAALERDLKQERKILEGDC